MKESNFSIYHKEYKRNGSSPFPPTDYILDNLTSGFFILDRNWSIIYLNKSMENWVGKERDDLIGSNIWDAFPDAVGTNFYYFYHQAMNEQISVTFEDYYERTQEWLKVKVEPYNEGIIGYVTNITENKKKEETIHHILFHDFVTGLPNRYMLNLRLSNELSIASEKNQSMAVLVINLDRFKFIIDSLGHDSGDFLLKEVTNRFKTALDHKQLLFRNGENEFIVMLADSDRNEAAKVATRIFELFNTPFHLVENEIFISLSIGISFFPDDGKTVETLLTHASFARYQSKKAGTNVYEFYSPTKNKVKIEPFKLEMELYKAIEQNQFSLHYQPKIDLRTGSIVGVEALIRWNHPKWGWVSPETFIKIAEDTGLIIPIGEWVLYDACKQLKNWQHEGFHTVVSVNLSPKQFHSSNIVNTIANVLQTTELAPHYLEVEITERMTGDIEHTIFTLQQLKKLGVAISIDDFGTGSSSFTYLKKFPIDTLKIAQSFVRELQHNPNEETIVKTIISMAHNLNLKVVAEGVETKEQLLFLQQHLCDQGQGYFFSKPMSASELKEQLFEVQQMVIRHGIPEDIGNRMWYEELLNQAKKDLQDTVRMQQGMIFKFKKINGQFVHTLCDGELLYRFGLVPAQVVGKRLDEFLPYENASKKTAYYQRAWDGEELVPYEDKFNGIYYLASLRPIKKGGEIIEVIGSSIDITARKQAELSLRESESRYRLITENMSDILMLLDKHGIIMYASPSLSRILGFSSKSYVGLSTFDLLHPEDRNKVKFQFQQSINGKFPGRMEARVLHSCGNWLLIEGNGSPVFGDKGELEHFVFVGRDITEKRRAEEQLAKTEKLAVVGDLAAGVAHEIRNPITSIKGFIQLIQQGLQKQEYFNIIFDEFQRLEDILQEFLNLAKPQSSKLILNDVTSILQDVKTLFQSEANLKNIKIYSEYHHLLPKIMCDRNQIKQVFINLIKNSMEAILNEGTIKIIGSIEKEMVLIKIMDNGIGISEERLKRLGEPFYSNKEKGTGLGLMLFFKIIRQHNGTIIVKSKENQGTTVEVRFPIPINTLENSPTGEPGRAKTEA
jgi:diguanylate cyclase (GGDEF)-like protein/PAS domain S-box-containing protein